MKGEIENTETPTLADYIQDILSRKAQAGKSERSQSLYNLKDAANMLNFLTVNKIMDMDGPISEIQRQKSLWESEQILFTAAKNYLKSVMNGKTTLPAKAWKIEYNKLVAGRNMLNQRYIALKDEVKEADQIRRSVYSILRQEQRGQQPRRAQGMEL